MVRGDKLEYRVLKLDAYKDKARIRENNLNRSKVEVDDNGLLDWVSNHHVATNSPSFILQQSGEEKLILKKKTREPLGSLTFRPKSKSLCRKGQSTHSQRHRNASPFRPIH